MGTVGLPAALCVVGLCAVSLVRRLIVFTIVTVISVELDQVTKSMATAALKGKPTLTYLDVEKIPGR